MKVLRFMGGGDEAAARVQGPLEVESPQAEATAGPEDEGFGGEREAASPPDDGVREEEAGGGGVDLAVGDEGDVGAGDHGGGDAGAAGPEPDGDLPLTLAEGWTLIEDESTPKNGKPVFLVGIVRCGPWAIPLVVGAFWHQTRRWGGSAMRWVDASYWKCIDIPEHVPFAPIAWSRWQ